MHLSIKTMAFFAKFISLRACRASGKIINIQRHCSSIRSCLYVSGKYGTSLTNTVIPDLDISNDFQSQDFAENLKARKMDLAKFDLKAIAHSAKYLAWLDAEGSRLEARRQEISQEILKLTSEADKEARCQFHQRFTYEFFVRTSFLAAFSRYVSALAPKFRTKDARVNVDEIDGREKLVAESREVKQAMKISMRDRWELEDSTVLGYLHLPNRLHENTPRDAEQQVSIPSTFYFCLFVRKYFMQIFSNYSLAL